MLVAIIVIMVISAIAAVFKKRKAGIESGGPRR
jgi:hypothetical protein